MGKKTANSGVIKTNSTVSHPVRKPHIPETALVSTTDLLLLETNRDISNRRYPNPEIGVRVKSTSKTSGLLFSNTCK